MESDVVWLNYAHYLWAVDGFVISGGIELLDGIDLDNTLHDVEFSEEAQVLFIIFRGGICT